MGGLFSCLARLLSPCDCLLGNRIANPISLCKKIIEGVMGEGGGGGAVAAGGGGEIKFSKNVVGGVLKKCRWRSVAKMSLEEQYEMIYLSSRLCNTSPTVFPKKNFPNNIFWQVKKVIHFANFGCFEVVFLTKCYGLRSSNDLRKVS